jgi:signal transduction histidine kinase
MASLLIRPGAADEHAYPLGATSATIGRAADQTICIVHSSLSRSHARVDPVGQSYLIVDLKSTNGTLVNGARVERAMLKDGDVVKLGDALLTFRQEPRDARERTVTPLATCGTQVVPTFGFQPGPREVAARARERLNVLIEMSKVLPVYVDVDDLLKKVLELVFSIVEVDRGAILLVDEATGRLEQRVTRTAAGGATTGAIYSQRIVDYVMRERVAAVFSDTRTDPRIHLSGSMVSQHIHASLCAPLQPRDVVIGVLYVDNQRAPQPFTSEDLELFAAFAGQAAVALENAALYRRLERETVARMQLVMEEKLSSLGAMLGRIAHELRNPINLMINFGEASQAQATELAATLASNARFLPEGPREDSEALLQDLRASTERVGQHGRRASAILEAMVHRTRSNKTAAREGCDLNWIVARSARGVCSAAMTAGVEVRLAERFAHGLSTIHAAPDELMRVFSAIVENACLAMRDKARALPGSSYRPELVVTTTNRPGAVEVSVRDNGIGIARPFLGAIFEPFFTTRPAGEGSGLGLWLAREIVVDGHQGTITADSVEREGTEVVVTLPLGSPPVPRASWGPTITSDERGSKGVGG